MKSVKFDRCKCILETKLFYLQWNIQQHIKVSRYSVWLYVKMRNYISGFQSPSIYLYCMEIIDTYRFLNIKKSGLCVHWLWECVMMKERKSTRHKYWWIFSSRYKLFPYDTFACGCSTAFREKLRKSITLYYRDCLVRAKFAIGVTFRVLNDF